jgi:hypothetical protein
MRFIVIEEDEAIYELASWDLPGLRTGKRHGQPQRPVRHPHGSFG